MLGVGLDRGQALRSGQLDRGPVREMDPGGLDDSFRQLARVALLERDLQPPRDPCT